MIYHFLNRRSDVFEIRYDSIIVKRTEIDTRNKYCLWNLSRLDGPFYLTQFLLVNSISPAKPRATIEREKEKKEGKKEERKEGSSVCSKHAMMLNLPRAVLDNFGSLSPGPIYTTNSNLLSEAIDRLKQFVEKKKKNERKNKTNKKVER